MPNFNKIYGRIMGHTERSTYGLTQNWVYYRLIQLRIGHTQQLNEGGTVYLWMYGKVHSQPYVNYVACSRYSDYAMGWTTQDSIPSRSNTVLFSEMSTHGLEPTQPPIQWVTGVHSLGTKRSEREADDSPPPTDKVKN
jgi:hypothetical protein